MSNGTSPNQRQQDEVILLALISVHRRYLAQPAASNNNHPKLTRPNHPTKQKKKLPICI